MKTQDKEFILLQLLASISSILLAIGITLFVMGCIEQFTEELIMVIVLFVIGAVTSLMVIVVILYNKQKRLNKKKSEVL